MGLFGNFFDFDGDGKSSMFETFLGLEALGFFDTKDDDEYDEDDTDSEEDEEDF